MKVSINKTDLKRIDYIIDHFIENNEKNETTSIVSLAFCLQKLIEGRDELAKALEEEEEDD